MLGQMGDSLAADYCFDVSLDPSGRISGMIVDSSGTPVGNLIVNLQGWDEFQASTRTSPDGSFALGVQRGGIYSISCGSATQQTCRVWKHGTAPPLREIESS